MAKIGLIPIGVAGAAGAAGADGAPGPVYATPLVSGATAVHVIPGVIPIAISTVGRAVATDYVYPFFCNRDTTFDLLTVEVTTQNGNGGSVARWAVYTANSAWQPVTLVEDLGTHAIDSTGVKTIAPAGGTRTLTAGRYVMVSNASTTGTWTGRSIRGCLASGALFNPSGTTSLFPNLFSVARVYGAFGAATAWTAATAAATAFEYPFWLRVTAVA